MREGGKYRSGKVKGKSRVQVSPWRNEQRRLFDEGEGGKYMREKGKTILRMSGKIIKNHTIKDQMKLTVHIIQCINIPILFK